MLKNWLELKGLIRVQIVSRSLTCLFGGHGHVLEMQILLVLLKWRHASIWSGEGKGKIVGPD